MNTTRAFKAGQKGPSAPRRSLLVRAMNLTLRRANDDPPSYRGKYDDVEIGSIFKRNHHVEHRDFWLWAIDTMPMMSHGGTPSYGEARNFDQAKKLSSKSLRNGEMGCRSESSRRT